MCWLVQTVCPSSAKKAPCKSTSFTYVEDSRECIDYQEIKIQEQVQSLTVGSIPRSIVVVLENDLVDSCKVEGAPSPVLLLPILQITLLAHPPSSTPFHPPLYHGTLGCAWWIWYLCADFPCLCMCCPVCRRGTTWL